MKYRGLILSLLLFFCCNLFALDNVVSEKEKRKFDYFFLEALRYKLNDDYTNAYLALQHCLSIDSTSAVANYELAVFYLFFRENDLALDALKKAVKYDPDRFEYQISLANFYRENRMTDLAIQIYEDLCEKYQDKPELNFYLSDLYVRQGKIEEAIRELNIIEENRGMDESISIQKYRLFSRIEQNDKAFNELEKLAEKYPHEAKYQILIGDLYLEKKEFEKAYQYYQRANNIDPQNPYYIVSMANYYELTGDQTAAEKEIDSALRNSKLDIETKLTILGRYIQNLQRNKKEVEQANGLFEILMEQHPQETELNLMYGAFLLTQEKTEEAKFQFQVVTETSPENMVAWEQLLRISFLEEKPDDSIEICKSALLHFPDVPIFYFYMGISYYQKDEYQESLQAYQDGLQYVEEGDVELISNFYGQIGDLYHQMKNKELAYENYEQALKYNDRNVAVLNNYAYYLSLDRKDLSRAERMSSLCVKMQPDNSTYIDTYAWIFFMQGNYTLAKFYIESAISNGGDKSMEIVDHYGDILYMTNDVDKAVEQWEKALELGKDTEIMRKKIQERKYYEEPNE